MDLHRGPWPDTGAQAPRAQARLDFFNDSNVQLCNWERVKGCSPSLLGNEFLTTREVRMAKDKSREHEDFNTMCGHNYQRQSTLPSKRTPGVAREKSQNTQATILMIYTPTLRRPINRSPLGHERSGCPRLMIRKAT